MKHLIIYFLLMMTGIGTYAQNYKSLSLGDTVPDLEFEMINYKKSTAKRSDFKGKLILMDFWSTSCTSCILYFPKMDSLQAKFGSKLQVLLVNTKQTGDNKTKITAFFNKQLKSDRSKYQLSTIFNDTVLNMLFKHRSIPHYAWLDGNGKVLAITSSKYVTEQNIEKVLRGEVLNLPVKADNFTALKQLFKEGNGIEPKEYVFRSILTKYNESLSQGRIFDQDKNWLYVRVVNVNTEAIVLYNDAYPELSIFNSRNRLIWEVKNPDKYRHLKTDDFENWAKDNAVNYELIMPPVSKDKMLAYMRSDLDRYFGLSVNKEIRRVKCLVLMNIDRSKNPKTKGGLPEYTASDGELFTKKYIRNCPAGAILDFYINKCTLPVVDESYIGHNVDMDFTDDLLDIPKMRKSLQKYGLDLVEEDREIGVMVLKDKID